MVLLVLAVFVATVAVLAVAARRSGSSGTGCCAPADPDLDLRMQDARTDRQA